MGGKYKAKPTSGTISRVGSVEYCAATLGCEVSWEESAMLLTVRGKWKKEGEKEVTAVLGPVGKGEP